MFKLTLETTDSEHCIMQDMYKDISISRINYTGDFVTTQIPFVAPTTGTYTITIAGQTYTVRI